MDEARQSLWITLLNKKIEENIPMSDKDLIIERANMVLSVLSQVPMAKDEEARKAGNLVYGYCRKAACKSKEDEMAWDEVFHHAMPM